MLTVLEYIGAIRNSVRCAKDHGPQCSRVLSEAAKAQKAEIAQLRLTAATSAARIVQLERENTQLQDKLLSTLESEHNDPKGRKRRSGRLLRELEAFNESPPKRRKLEAEAETTAQEPQASEHVNLLEDLPMSSARGMHCTEFQEPRHVADMLSSRKFASAAICTSLVVDSGATLSDGFGTLSNLNHGLDQDYRHQLQIIATFPGKTIEPVSEQTSVPCTRNSNAGVLL